VSNQADVRTENGRVELRVNGAWEPSSKEHVLRLLGEGWLIYWNPRIGPVTSWNMKNMCPRYPN